MLRSKSRKPDSSPPVSPPSEDAVKKFAQTDRFGQRERPEGSAPKETVHPDGGDEESV